ncbi:MAG: hypothetical protein Q9208_005865 [Pyrenodesmia sp. 3 TL-2023]
MASLFAGPSLLLLFLVQSILTAAQLLETRATILNSTSNLKDQYDYIVVGGGTSGLTVANRLAEDASATRARLVVALVRCSWKRRDKLEPGVLVPGVPPPAEYSRNYQSVPQPGLNNKPQAVNSAAVVGGGTVINGMFFQRGSAGDYDNWAKLGNPGWGWTDLLPYFKKYVSRNDTKKVLSVQAGEEVIVAAGAPRSPQLLQISGIGPRKLLKGLGIDVVQSLPGVGYNFQDQPAMFASVTCLTASALISESLTMENADDQSKYPFPSPDLYFTNQSWVAQQLEIYYQNRTGPNTQAYLSGTTVALLSLQRTTNQYQEIIRSAQKANLKKALPAGADKTLLEGYKAQQSAILANYASPDTAIYELAFLGGSTVPLVLTKPLSRGSIFINSSDPLADPVFDYRTFQHPADIEVFIEMFKKFRQFVAAEPWKAVGLEEKSPGASVQGNQAIEAAIRNITSSTWSHPVGTCAMMPKEHGGVVDPQLRVYGIKGLSVVDASIMPIIPAAHTQSTVYAVAEKDHALSNGPGLNLSWIHHISAIVKAHVTDMDLPNEVILMVLTRLPKSDLKHFRLACKRLATLGAQVLIGTLHIPPRDADMEVFDAITQHPDLTRSVQNLFFDTAQFQKYTSELEYYEALCEQLTSRRYAIFRGLKGIVWWLAETPTPTLLMTHHSDMGY